VVEIASSKADDSESENFKKLFNDGSDLQPIGALPLHISDDHWRIAKHNVLSMAGFICCGDPILGTNEMVMTLYLMALQHCSKANSEFYNKKAQQLRDVITLLIAEIPQSFPSCRSFKSSVTRRLRDVIGNLSILELFWDFTETAEERASVAPYLAEEYLRRSFQGSGDSGKSDLQKEIEKVYISPVDETVEPFAIPIPVYQPQLELNEKEFRGCVSYNNSDLKLTLNEFQHLLPRNQQVECLSPAIVPVARERNQNAADIDVWANFLLYASQKTRT